MARFAQVSAIGVVRVYASEIKSRHKICIKALVLSFAMRRLRIAMTEAMLQSGSATTPQVTLLPSPLRLDVEPISQYGIEEG